MADFIEKLAQTWPAKMGRTFIEALALPGDVYAGRTSVMGDDGHTNSEVINRSADLAGILGLGGTGAAQQGAVGIFGGRLAKTADLNKLAQAEKMAVKGSGPSDIWDATGWFRGPDGAWRFEIPDTAAFVDHSALRQTGRIARAENYLAERGYKPLIGNPSVPQDVQNAALKFADQTANSRGTVPMREYLKHDALYEAYPSLRELPVGMESNISLRGSFDPQTNIIRTGGGSIADRSGMRDTTVLHELQHKVQEIENFARGGASIDPDYKRLAGEVEARNVQKRARTGPAYLKNIPPQYSQDTPFSEQVVRLGYSDPLRMPESRDFSALLKAR